jgi:hypothetical protein
MGTPNPLERQNITELEFLAITEASTSKATAALKILAPSK